jgi:glycosyltransferase involved in cell wall biosynthesis
MRILQIMFFSCEEIYKYNKLGNEHQLHNLYGYDYLSDLNDISVHCIYPNLGVNYFKMFPKFSRLIFEIHLIKLQLKCALISRDYDVIYSPHDFHLFPLALFRILGLCKKPIFSISHFAYNENLISKKSTQLYRIFERFIYYNGIDKISFLNDNILNLATKAYNVPDRHRTSMGWGSNFGFFNNYVLSRNLPPKNDFFISLGTQNRDYTTLINAFKYTDAKLFIFGGLNHSESIENFIPPNVVFDKSIVQGLDSVVRLREHYYNSIAVLIPILRMTDISNGASVIVEALSMGKPIVITDFPINYIDVEKEKVGFKISPGDLNGWKIAIQWLRDHPVECAEMGARALQLAQEKYNYEYFCENLLCKLKQTCK